MLSAPEVRFLVLHGLRLKGFAEAPAVAAAVGLDAGEVAEQLAKLDADGLATHREGRLPGWSLTREGLVEQERLAGAEVAATGATDDITATYRRFLDLNDRFKVLCTDWQLRGGELYDRGDAAYNSGIVDRLVAIHDKLGPVLGGLAAGRPRFHTYQARFAGALDGFRTGDLDLLTKPIIDSYHTIWFELHEDLLCGLGIDRSQEGAT